MQRIRHFILLGALGSLCACSQSSPHARQLQASGTLTAGRNLAMTSFRATAVAALRQPVTTTKLGLAVLWHRPTEVLRGNLPIHQITQIPIPEQPGSSEFENLLDRHRFPRAESGTLKWLVDGPGFFPELDREIAAARESIDLQLFIFDNDDVAVRYADVLKSRADEVKVRVLFDDLGSTFAQTSAPETLGPRGFVPPSDIGNYLEKGSKVRARRILDPWLVSDHTKLLVFDEQRAILGGMNLGREYYSEWHDLMVKVEGPVVTSLTREFNRAWRKAGPWGDFALIRKPSSLRPPQPSAVGIPLRVLRTDPAEGRYDILEVTLLAIRGARERVWIENPYFANDEIVQATAAAARRGVDVRVILPEKGDSSLMDVGNLATSNVLIRAGARVYMYPRMTHLKVMICDDWATVGSANLDTLSMRINRELNLAFSQAAAVEQLNRAIFRPDFRQSRRVSLEETQSAGSLLAEVLADQF